MHAQHTRRSAFRAFHALTINSDSSLLAFHPTHTLRTSQCHACSCISAAPGTLLEPTAPGGRRHKGVSPFYLCLLVPASGLHPSLAAKFPYGPIGSWMSLSLASSNPLSPFVASACTSLPVPFAFSRASHGIIELNPSFSYLALHLVPPLHLLSSFPFATHLQSGRKFASKVCPYKPY